MKPLFLFGTLRHPPLLEAVLGTCDHIGRSAARALDISVSSAPGGAFPVVVPQPGARAEGLLLDGLSEADRARLDFYEGAFGYARGAVVLEDGGSAEAYLPEAGRWTPAGPWSLEDWVRDWSSLSVFAAQEVMGYFGSRTPDEIARMFPMIRARAWSRMNAAQSLHGEGTLAGRVEITSRKRAYADYFALDDYLLRHETFGGGSTEEVRRAVFLAPDAAIVLPYDPLRDRVLLVEQMRVGPLARGDAKLWQLEPIAGRLDPGESPQDAARREALEEAGIMLGALEPVAESYSSPGNSSEFHYIFVGLADLPESVAGTGGLAAEDEDIRSHVMSFERLMDLCETRRVCNAPLVLAAYWLACHRARLRDAAGIREA